MQDQNLQQPPIQNQSTSYPQNQYQVENQNQIPVNPLPQPSQKKGFLRIVLIIIIVFLLLGVLVFLFRIVSSRLGQAVQSNKDVEITWWGFWEDSSIVDPIIAQYQEANPNVKINYVRQNPEDYRERLASAIASGRGPDIFKIHNSWVPMFRQELSTLPADVMSQQEYQETFYRVALEAALTDKGIVAIPLEYDGLGLFINEEIFSTFAETIPQTWDELRETARNITLLDTQTSNLRQSGVALGLTDNVDYWQDIVSLMLMLNRARLTEPSDNQSIGAISFYKQFVQTDRVWESAQANSVTAFTTGRVGMIFATSREAHEIREQNPSLDFRVVPIPQLAKNSPDDPDVAYATFWMEGVSARSEAQKQSWEFLKFMSSPENLERLYQNAAKSPDDHPEIYPRQDMRNKLLADRYVGGIVKQAPDARFWYLASKTNDGETGINTQLSELFKGIISSDRVKFTDFGLEVRGLLARYGLAQPIPVIEN